MAIREDLIQSRSLYVGTSPNVAPNPSNLIIDGIAGIGTTSPNLNTSGNFLHINGSGSNAAMVHFTNSDTGSAANQGLIVGRWSDGNNYLFTYNSERINIGTEGNIRMTVAPNGYVGFNTTNPYYDIHIHKPSSESGILTSYGASNIYISHGGWGVGAAKLGIGSSSNPTILVNTSNNCVGIGNTSPSQRLQVTNGNVYVDQGGFIGYRTDGGTGLEVNGGDLGPGSFIARFKNYYNTDRVVVTGNGYVGIGTSSPSTSLHIANGNDSFTLYGPNSGWGAYLWVGAGENKTSNANAQVIATNGNLHLDSGTGQQTYINSYAQTATLINPQGGNVAVGTFDVNSYPYAAKFNVNGSISSSGGKIGFGVTDAFTAYGHSVAHYGISYGSSVYPVAVSGYYGVGFFSQGSERMRVTDDGDVAIGTTYTYGNKLTVNGGVSGTPNWDNATLELRSDSGLTTALAFHRAGYTVSTIYSDDGSISFSTSNVQRVKFQDVTGYVGINTNSPQNLLHVKVAGAENQTIARFECLNNNRGLTIGTSAEGAVNDANVVYNNLLGGYGGHIWQNGGSEYMRLTASGSVGIGTTSPFAKLTVSGDVYGGNILISNANFNSFGSTLSFTVNSSERMRITTNGSVGIGTTNPSEKLSVVGTIQSLPVSASEGGQLTLRSGSSYSYRWNIDNYEDNFRIFREDDPNSANGYVAFFMNSVGTAGFNTTSPARSAILDLTARDRGFLPPRMTNTEMNAINTPATGLIVYDTTNNKVTVFNGSSWVPLH